MAWDRRVPSDSNDESEATGSADAAEASVRQALDAVLHGHERDPEAIHTGTPMSVPPLPTDPDVSVAGPRASHGALGAWETLVRFEEARWLRYGRPCVAVQMEIVGGHEVASRLGPEAASRIRERVDELLASMTRASDRFEHRPGWRVVALLPETDMAGATAALERLQRAFAEAMGPALSVRIALGLASPAPTGTLSVAFHQAKQQLIAQRRRGHVAPVPPEDGGRAADDATMGPSGEAAASAELSARPGATREALGPARDPAQRLDALARLLQGGQISEGEYSAKRAEIIDRL